MYLFETKHFREIQNWADLISLSLNVLVLTMVFGEMHIEKIRIVASLATCALWFQLIFWFRLFDSLANHV